VAVPQQILCLLFVPLAVVGFAPAQTGTSTPTLETIITRMAQARAEIPEY
jgi:hypothetical protein